jgi:hypothetical protein
MSIKWLTLGLMSHGENCSYSDVLIVYEVFRSSHVCCLAGLCVFELDIRLLCF